MHPCYFAVHYDVHVLPGLVFACAVAQKSRECSMHVMHSGMHVEGNKVRTVPVPRAVHLL